MKNISSLLLTFLLIIIKCAEDYYKLLGVPRNASKQQIKKAFKKLSLKYHPDKNKNNKRAKDMFVKIANAYEVLSNDEERKIYDQYGEEGVKQHQAGQNAGQGGGFNFNGANFDDIFKTFFGGGRGGMKGGRHKFHINMGGEGFGDFGGFRGFKEEEEEKNYFENSDVISVKMDNLSKLISRRLNWFVLFYKNMDVGLEKTAKIFKDFASKTYGIFKVGSVNCINDEEICDEYNVHSTPKILFFPESSKEEVTYKGKIEFGAMFKYGNKAMQNFVRVINKDNFNDYLQNKPEIYHILLFTSKKSTPPLFKAFSKFYVGKLSFGEVRESEKELMQKFKVRKTPKIIVLDDNGEEEEEFKDEMKYERIKKFLGKFAYKKKEEDKSVKLRQLNEGLYNSVGMCSASDGKNLCLIFINQNNELSKENKVKLERIGEKYINEHLKVFFLNKENYPSIYKQIQQYKSDNEEIIAFILKGKRKRILTINTKVFKMETELFNLIENVLSGGGNFKKFEGKLKFKNENQRNVDL